MAATTRLAWEAVADVLDALVLELKVHFQQASEEVIEVNEALERLGTAIEATFSTIGAVVKDPALRDDANNFAVALMDALADTLSRGGQEFEKAAKGLRRHRTEAPDGTSKQPADNAR